MRCFQHPRDLPTAYARFLCHAEYSVNLTEVSFSYAWLRKIGTHFRGTLNLWACVNPGRWEFLGVQSPSTWHIHVGASQLLEAIYEGNSRIHLPLGYISMKPSDSNLTAPLRFSTSRQELLMEHFPLLTTFLCGRGACLAYLQNEIFEETVFCTSTCISAHWEL